MPPALLRPLRILAIVALAAASAALLDAADARRPSKVDTLLDAPKLPADVMRRLSLGFHTAVADANFLAAIQLFGDKEYARGTVDERRRRGEALYRLLDYTTNLDPRFDYAYVFGAVAIPSQVEPGRFINLQQAVQLLEKGVRTGGPDWRIPFHLAYQYSAYVGDLEKAAFYMAEAARRPRRPEYVPLLAARLAAAGGAIETGIAFTRAMLETTDDAEQREALEERVRLLEMERDLRRIEDAASDFEHAKGRRPASVRELVDAGLLEAVPDEPHGGAYELDRETGEVRSTAAERLRLPKQVRDELDQIRRVRERERAAPTEPRSPQP